MALIDAEHPSVAESSRQFWENELANSRILLADVNARIHKLEIEDFSLDTGQNSQRVKRSALDSLINTRVKLIEQIKELETELGLGTPETGQLIQGVPW
jgi:hypothetical protein